MGMEKKYHLTIRARHVVEMAGNIAERDRRTPDSADILAGLLHGEDYVSYALEKKAGIDRSEFDKLAATNGKIKDTVTLAGMLEEAQSLAQIEGMEEIDTLHLLKAAIADKRCNAMRVLDIMKISQAALVEAYESAFQRRKQGVQLSGKHTSLHQARQGMSPVMAAYCVDLTKKARDGLLDPIVGRDKEIARTIDILLRRTKSNPCLIGEAGVGKTAVAEGLAQRIADGDVPDKLKGVIIAELSLSGLVAGAKYRGDFEERLTKLLDEVIARNDAILFIDEIHAVVGSGAAEGAQDCASILKPHLARGGLRVIGATTIHEYRKYIEPDAALGRRFHEVMVNEVDEAAALTILKALKVRYETYHNVSIEDNVLSAAVKLSARYLLDRRLPDKAIDLIDESSARACAKGRRYITENDVALVVSEITGINVMHLTRGESEMLLQLEEILHQSVIGQDKAVNALARAIRRGKTGLRDPNRPIGSFLFTGPTGVGKTELSVALADALLHSADALVRLDMSEYMEAASISKLIGAAPGYVGYGDGGTLTDKIRTKPYAVVLFDEIEKAHPDVLNALLQILEDGTLTDSQGRKASFKNAVIVMTSNIGARNITEAKSLMGFAHSPVKPDVTKEAESELRSALRPEFLNRIDEIIVFGQLSLSEVKAIAGKYLRELAGRLMGNGIRLEVSDAVVTLLAHEGFDDRYGARPLKKAIRNRIEDKIADLILLDELSADDTIECDLASGAIIFKVNSLACMTK